MAIEEKLKVAVVHQEPYYIGAFTDILETAGIDFDIYTSASAALTGLKEKKYDLIITKLLYLGYAGLEELFPESDEYEESLRGGMAVIKQAHAEGSLNRTTPIWVIDVYRSGVSPIGQDKPLNVLAEEAGAENYIHAAHSSGFLSALQKQFNLPALKK